MALRAFQPFPTASREAFFYAADTAEGGRTAFTHFFLLTFHFTSILLGRGADQALRPPRAGQADACPACFLRGVREGETNRAADRMSGALGWPKEGVIGGFRSGDAG